MKQLKIKVVVIIGLIVVAFIIHLSLQNRPKEIGPRESNFAKNVTFNNPLLKAFKKKFENGKVLVACEEDVTNDNCKDLVVIYKSGKHVRMVVVTDCGDGENFKFSKPVPAPVENQGIQFDNIDGEGEIEFIVSGEKKGVVGYAIYRMIDGEPSDLFGDGMEDCC